MNHMCAHRMPALRVGLAAFLSLLATAVAAQTFPSKSIRIVAPFPAASVADVLARPIAQKMNETWGQPVIVDNRTGANGSAVLPHIRTGKMRLITISAADRDPTMPEVPTIADTVCGFEMAPWFGLFGPAGTPSDFVVPVNTETVRILALP